MQKKVPFMCVYPTWKKKLGSCYIWTRYYISSSKCEKEKDLSKGWMLRIPFQGVAMTEMLIYFFAKKRAKLDHFCANFQARAAKMDTIISNVSAASFHPSII